MDIGAGFHILALGLAHLLILKEFVFQMRETWNIIKKEPYVPFMMREDYTVLSQKDKIEEFMFLGLRKRAGISRKRVQGVFS